MISIGVFGAAQIMIFWLPTYLRSVFHLNVTKTAGYMVLNILGSFIGNLMYGPIADRYGRRPVFVACLAVQSAAVGAYVGFTSNLVLTLVLGFVVGLLQGGLSNGVQPIIAELFGTRIRGRAFGINNAIVRAAAAVMVGLVGLLATHFSFGLSIGLLAICLYAVAVCGVLLVKETKGIELPTEIVPIASRARP
jgi:MFS family permease